MHLRRLASQKSAEWAIRVGIQDSLCCSSSPKAVCWKNSLLLREVCLVLFRPSMDWVRPTHIMEGNLLFSKSTDLDVNLIQKHSYRNSRIIQADT